jgi:hypothetical protein
MAAIYSNGGNRWNILGFNFTKRDALSSVYKAKKKICGFPVSRPYLAFGRRNPDPKLFYWIMRVSVST